MSKADSCTGSNIGWRLLVGSRLLLGATTIDPARAARYDKTSSCRMVAMIVAFKLDTTRTVMASISTSQIQTQLRRAQASGQCTNVDALALLFVVGEAPLYGYISV